jgi:hypothetical protein
MKATKAWLCRYANKEDLPVEVLWSATSQEQARHLAKAQARTDGHRIPYTRILARRAPQFDGAIWDGVDINAVEAQ